MAKLAVLKIVDGDFERGFQVTLRLGEQGDPTVMEIDGRLPPAPMIPIQYDRWQSAYRTRSLGSVRKLEAKKGQETNRSTLDSATVLQQSINEWLNSGNREFQPIRDGLLENLSRTEEIRFIIRSEAGLLWRLPWHLWNFFERYSQAEVCLSTPDCKQVKLNPTESPQAQVKILVILGDSTDINVQQDLELLRQQLPNAYIWCLKNPQRNQLSDELWERDWDILFFAGHSSSEAGDGKGRIYINQTENLTIEELKYDLKRAITHGLKLAIFNSCDGISLARDLADLQISATIVMRERVPDWVAQKFLEYFLKAFATDEKSLYASVREARERLHSLEGKYPCASWLPAICQNPAEVPPTWRELRDRATSERQPFSLWRGFQTVLMTSMVVTGLLIGVRSFGILQNLELKTFDQSLRLRPNEGQDQRLLVVKVTEQDIQKLGQYPLTDQILVKLFKKLEQYQPRAIGLDIYRDLPQQPGRAELVKHLQQSDHLIAVCEVGGGNENPGIRPPAGVPEKHLGFTDFVRDSDGILRRHLLAMAPDSSPCQTDKSFSLQLARRYLAKSGIQLTLTPEQYFQLDTVVFKTLENESGGYHQLDYLGHQVLLNYRSSPEIAPQVSLSKIVNGSLDRELPNLVKDRVVLIGTTAKSVKDYFHTPYSAVSSPVREMPGVVVHAHMVSQILSAVLDNRPLLWVLPKWGEFLWIWYWSVVGGVICFYWRSRIISGIAIATTVGILYVICFAVLTQGGWLPFVPSVLVLVTTGGSVVAYDLWQKLRHK